MAYAQAKGYLKRSIPVRDEAIEAEAGARDRTRVVPEAARFGGVGQ